MDQVLPPLLAFPPHPPPVTPLPDSEYDKQIKSLVQHLNVLSANKLTAVVPGEGNLLDVCTSRLIRALECTRIILTCRWLVDSGPVDQYSPIPLRITSPHRGLACKTEGRMDIRRIRSGRQAMAEDVGLHGAL